MRLRKSGLAGGTKLRLLNQCLVKLGQLEVDGCDLRPGGVRRGPSFLRGTSAIIFIFIGGHGEDPVKQQRERDDLSLSPRRAGCLTGMGRLLRL